MIAFLNISYCIISYINPIFLIFLKAVTLKTIPSTTKAKA